MKKNGDPAPLRQISGGDLRRIRELRRLRLRDVSVHTGLSITKLSRIETEAEPLTPGVEILIAKAYWP